MKIKNISFPTPLTEIVSADNDNLDVIIELEDGSFYTLVVITPLNILTLMEKGGVCFLEPGMPMIVVRELTEQCIFSAIQSFSEGDAYWLKEYYLSGGFDIHFLNKMLSEVNKSEYSN